MAKLIKFRSHNVKNKFQTALTLATELAPLVPNGKDNVFSTGLKLLAAANHIRNFFGPEDAVESYMKDMEVSMEEHASRLIVDTFHATPIHERFETQRHVLSKEITMVFGRSRYGNIYFIEHQSLLGGVFSDKFYTSKDFDFEGMLEGLWDCYDSQIHVNVKYNHYSGRMTFSFSPIVFTNDPISEEALVSLEKLTVSHKRFIAKNYPRTYLLVGAPGVGKTTFSLRFAKASATRVLRIDSEGLSEGGTEAMGQFIENLKPEFILIEDIDREVSKSTISTILETLTDFKERFPQVTVVMTANDIRMFDAAITRPGRIDKVIYFSTPDDSERKHILEKYFSEFGIDREVPTEVVKASEGLTAAYLKEVAIQFDCEEEIPDIISSIEVMKGLTRESATCDDPDED